MLNGGRPMVLDGGLSTELERRGHDISGRLWSARLLHDAPEAVVAAHSAFLRAGAQVITTASYQASPEGFARAGFSAAEGERLLRLSVELAQRARDEVLPGAGSEVWVAGSVGPYGAMLADGSEYTGDYRDLGDFEDAVSRLRAFHRPRLEILLEAGVDVLAVETIPSLAETEALVAELAALDRPSWLSLTTVIDADGVVRTRRGEPAEQAYALAAEVDSIIAVGVNCTEPAGLSAAIEVAAVASGKPVVAYPNSGEGWDAAARNWTGSAATGFDILDVESWISAGARVVGGCCRVGPEAIAGLARQFTVLT
jgi:S-methylmethionine-dependent homocysteine/selenocysteine methylase